MGIVRTEISTLYEDAYYAKELGDSYTKEEIRQLVFEHIVRRGDDGYQTFFGMPGIEWKLENALAKQWGEGARFIGIDRHWTVIECGQQNMPRRSRCDYSKRLQIGKSKSIMSGYQTKMSVSLNLDFDSYVSLYEMRMSGSQQRHRRRLLRNLTCAWIDTYGGITHLHKTLPKLHKFIDRERRRIPIAITFIVGREDQETFRLISSMPAETGVERRALFLGACLHRKDDQRKIYFKYSGCVSYKSEGGAPMGILLGVLRNKGVHA